MTAAEKRTKMVKDAIKGKQILHDVQSGAMGRALLRYGTFSLFAVPHVRPSGGY
jgi:hypothetical protein